MILVILLALLFVVGFFCVVCFITICFGIKETYSLYTPNKAYYEDFCYYDCY
jgi:hypothetical protein